jgi:hypothetical protein
MTDVDMDIPRDATAAGTCRGLGLMPCHSTATNKGEPRDVGITSPMTNTSQQIGASIGTALVDTTAAAAVAARQRS